MSSRRVHEPTGGPSPTAGPSPGRSPSGRSKRGERGRGDGSEAATALVAAASALLDEAGPEALTVRAIAHRAGCSTMVVYSHFGGKDGVVEALYVQGFERLGAALRAVRHTADPVADLQRLGRAYRRFALDHPTSYRVMFTRAVPDFEASAAAAALASATLDVLAERVARAVDAGSLGPGEPRQLAACLWAAIHGAVSLELQDAGPPDIDWPVCHERMLAALASGLG